MKLIDFELNGFQLVLSFGDDNCNNYWGDDWNDAPYEHNAGKVYKKFVKKTLYFNLNPAYVFAEPCAGHTNSPFSKENMKKRKIPCFSFVDIKDYRKNTVVPITMKSVMLTENSQSIYFGDSEQSVIEKLGNPITLSSAIDKITEVVNKCKECEFYGADVNSDGSYNCPHCETCKLLTRIATVLELKGNKHVCS